MSPLKSHKPTAQEVEAALQRVLQAPQFRKAPKAGLLLSYLVKSSLEGRRSLPTEREVAKRLDLSDNTVWELATSLRKMLADYYEQNKPPDAAQFTLFTGGKRGGYLVEFSRPEYSHLDPVAGADLRSVREKRALTLKALAEMVGVTPRTISRVEAGETVRAETIGAIANVLGVSLGDLARSRGTNVAPVRQPEADFEIHFDPAFEPVEVKEILTALADYYRSTGGAGFKIDFESQEATVGEPVHA